MIINALGGEHVTDAVVITVTMGDGTSAAGRVVTIWNVDDDVEFEHFTYSGQPHTSNLPVGMHAEISAGEIAGYSTPAPVRVYALGGVPRSVMLEYKLGVRYGFKREKANSAPDARITYLYEAVGMTPAYMDFDADTFNWGDWKPFVERVARPVMLKTDGTVDYELDHDDQTLKLDGTASDVSNTSYDGNAMVEFGKAFQWVKRYEDAEFEYVIFCDVQMDETYHAYAHTNASGAVQDAFYWGMFHGLLSSSKLRSVGTGAAYSKVGVSTAITNAEANGDGYHIGYKSGREYITDLLVMLGKSDHTQAVFGIGTTSLKANGTTVSQPAFYGDNSGSRDVKVLWIEGFFGNVSEQTSGYILDSGVIKVKMTPPYSLTGEGYVDTGITPSGTSDSYISGTKLTDETGLLPVTVSGSSTTYLCDVCCFSKSGVYFAIFGGNYYSTPKAWPGVHAVFLNHTAASTNATWGPRLTYVPSNSEEVA